jgi:O-antigen/teichoic acid export membrane protein
VQQGVLAGFEGFRAIAIVNITRGIGTLLLTIPLVYFWRVEGAFAAMGLAGAVAYGMSLFQVAAVTKAHGIPRARMLDWEHGRVLWTFSLPTVLAGVLVSPVTWLASLWLSRQAHGYAELGLFGAANQWRLAISFIPAILAQPLLPLLTSLGEGRRKSFERLVIFSAVLNGGVAVLAGAGVLVSIPLISMIYGKSFAGLSSVLIPLLVAGVFCCAATPIGEALASEERMWLGFTLNLIWAGCLLTLAHFAIPAMGARGLAYSFLGAYSLHMLTTGYCVLQRRQSTRAIG